MNARNVHAVLAAGVQQPNLIARWQADPSFLRGKGIDPATIDLPALRKFAGLTIKVKHNGLRPDLPLTFRLMSLAELDIAIFADYAIYCAETGHRLAKTSAERTCDLISFLESWLNLKRHNHSLLWDMIRHEQALAQLRKPAPQASADTTETAGDALRSSSVPYVRGTLILHRLQSDPAAVRPFLFRRPLRLDQAPRENHFYGYWRSGAGGEVQILDLDEFGFYALKLVDGITSLAEMNRRMGGGARPSKAFKVALQQLADLGILGFRAASVRRKK